MKRYAIVALLFAAAACRGDGYRDGTDTSTVGGAVAPPSTVQTDTAGGTTSVVPDTTGAMTNPADTMGKQPTNQTQSGVTNPKTGASTLGPGARKAEPTQGQAVTSKGDTIKPKAP